MPKKSNDFVNQVFKALGKKPISLAAIARKLGLADENNFVLPTTREKVRRALTALRNEGKAVKHDDKSKATYAKA